MSALLEVFDAIYTTLAPDATLAGLLTTSKLDSTKPAIFKVGVPEAQALNYLQLGDQTTEQAILLFGLGSIWDARFPIHCWTQVHNVVLPLQIAKSLNRLLHGKQLTLADGFTNLSCILESPPGLQGPILDADGISYHTILNYRLYSQ